MNKKKQLIVFLIFLIAVIFLLGIWKKIETNPTNVFHKSVKSIVELKVVSATHGENYGTAVLQMKTLDASFTKISMGDSENVKYGQKVYAIGNTLNYGISITEGIVSNNNIEIEDNGVIYEVIQADLNITPGNSGGALLDRKGRIIGITSFRTKTDDEYNFTLEDGYLTTYTVTEHRVEDDIAKMVSRDMLERSEELKKRFGTYEPHFHKVDKKRKI